MSSRRRSDRPKPAPLLGTLAAVGATRRTRRAMAAAQATYLGLLGAVLGVLVGIPPDIAISRILTSTYTAQCIDQTSVIVQVPWLQILLPVILVPLVAGALAWVSIRRAPTVTRGRHEPATQQGMNAERAWVSAG